MSSFNLSEPSLQPLVDGTLESLGYFTFIYYFYVELRSGNEEKLDTLRATMRDFIGSVFEKPEAANSFIKCLLKFGPLFYETPELGVKVHERVRSLPGFAAVAVAAFRGRSERPSEYFDWTSTLYGWRSADRDRAEDVWKSFLFQHRGSGFSSMQRPKREANQPPFAFPQHTIKFDAPKSPAQQVVLKPPSKLKTIYPDDIVGFAHGLHQKPSDRVPVLTASVLTLTNGSFRFPLSALWAENKLWVLIRAESWSSWTSPGFGRANLVKDYVLAAFDGTTCVETNSIPQKFLSGWQWPESFETAVFPDRVLFLSGQSIVTCGRNDKTSSLSPSPLNSPRAFVWDDRLCLYNGESLLQTTRELKDFKVLASVRRRPALTPLDELPTLAGARLFQAAGRLFIALADRTFILEGGTWSQVNGRFPILRESISEVLPVDYAAQEVLLRESSGAPNGGLPVTSVSYYGKRAAQPELWWSNDPQIRSNSRVAPKYPHLPARLPFFQREATPGTIIRHDGLPEYFGRQAVLPARGELLTLSIGALNEPARLYLWATNSSQPLAMTVHFPERERFMAMGERILLAENRIYLWVEPGMNRDVNKLWYVDLEATFTEFARMTYAQAKANVKASDFVADALTRFDRNGNGRLDPEEYVALADEPALFDLAWSELDANHNNEIEGQELRFFDFNMDGRLSEIEHRALLNAVSYCAASLYLLLETNGDAGLQVDETKSYLGRLNASNLFQKYDVGNSGTLDLERWTMLLAELLDKRFASGGGKQSPMPARIEFLEPGLVEGLLTVSSQGPKCGETP